VGLTACVKLLLPTLGRTGAGWPIGKGKDSKPNGGATSGGKNDGLSKGVMGGVSIVSLTREGTLRRGDGEDPQLLTEALDLRETEADDLREEVDTEFDSALDVFEENVKAVIGSSNRVMISGTWCLSNSWIASSSSWPFFPQTRSSAILAQRF